MLYEPKADPEALRAGLRLLEDDLAPRGEVGRVNQVGQAGRIMDIVFFVDLSHNKLYALEYIF